MVVDHYEGSRMKIAMLLSGGVDSSVALRLLAEEGHDLRAFYLKVWLEDEVAALGECPWEEDLGYVRSSCEQLDVALDVIPLQKEYLDTVIAYALDELRAGRTPSPDIMCNQRIKFGAFLDHLDSSFDRIASGHYAQLDEAGGDVLLKRAPDPVKDQTYFLSNLVQAQLRQLLFPIGHLLKSDVRQLAADFELPTVDRKDSQGICFLGKVQYRDFIQFHLGERRGNIIDRETGKTLGEHKGYWFHTIGQRFGLGLSGGPWYVVEKVLNDNAILVSHQQQNDGRQRSTFDVHHMNWISSNPVFKDSELQVKLRHGPECTSCTIRPQGDRLKVELAQPDSGIAAGQHAVFYDGDICLGGGVIG